MIRKPPRGLFVAGVDTEVGKTYIASMIAKQLTAEGRRVGVYKPLASGAEMVDGELVWHDPLSLWEAAGRPLDLTAVCPQTFKAPLAPHVAAELEGRQVDSELLRTGISCWAENCDIVIVEGAGGLMSPVNDDEYVADLAYDFGFPTLVVAANRLGVINHTLQSLITAATFREGIPVCGVVLNSMTKPEETTDASLLSNADQLRQRCQCPILDEVEHSANRFSKPVDWWALADMKS